MRWLLYIKIVCGNKKNLVLTHGNFYIFVFLVLKGDVVAMEEKNDINIEKAVQSNSGNILENRSNIDDSNWKGKDVIARVSNINNRPTRTSTVYELEVDPENSEKVLNFITTSKDSLGLHTISIVKENEKEIEENENINNENKNNENNILIQEKNKNLKILIEIYGEDAGKFKKKFDELKKENKLDSLELNKVQELYAVDLGKDKNDAQIKLTKHEENIIGKICGKKYWILKTLTKEEQVDFIGKLIQLADNKYKDQRKELLGNDNSAEYVHYLTLIFNSGYLTYDALTELNNYLHPKKINQNIGNLHDEIKAIWDNVFNELIYRDISGKRDRFKVMIDPLFQAKIIGYHIKLAEHLRSKQLLDDPENKEAFYNYIIQVAEREHSKTSKEFWSNFFLHVLAKSFVITFVGLIISALLSLSGLGILAVCAVLLVNSFMSAAFKFHADYKIFPWDWSYWWQNAKGNCLAQLKSLKMKKILLEGNTDALDAELSKSSKKEEDKLNSNDITIDSHLSLVERKKMSKKQSKRYWFWCKFCAVVCVVALLMYFFPSAVEVVISALLAVFKIELTLTIPAVVVSASLWIAIAAIVLAVVFYFVQRSYSKNYKQLKFKGYQQNIPSRDDKYFMQLNGKREFYEPQELKTAGIDVKGENQENNNLNIN